MLNLRSKITRAVLSYLMLHDHAELYVQEMARRLCLDDSNLAKKLVELEKDGLLRSRSRGRERYYSLDPKFPLLKEYRQIVLKTVGLEAVLKNVLSEIKGLEEAYLYGSYARDRMDSASDVDLLAVGSHSTIDLQKALAKVQKTTDREINLVSMSRQEYDRRKKEDSFIRSLQKTKKVKLVS
ncbi:MAG: nucleotidyltransferase domain-containing protein [Candidatus Omnitrophica bacterium]|nr:nucleotidyltransferase domain-containing protein [Candidatus Omnitrophota bacterium]